MKVEIKCPSCQVILGSLEKESLTPNDIEEYATMLRCQCSEQVELIMVE